MEGFTIGERKRLDAAHLSLYVVQRTGRLGLMVLFLHALFGRLRQAKDLDVLSAEKILFNTRHKLIRVATDGEVSLTRSPLESICFCCQIRNAGSEHWRGVGRLTH